MRIMSTVDQCLGISFTLSVCLTDGDWEVCLHTLRLLQSVLLEEDVLLLLGSSLLDPDLQARVSRLTTTVQPSLRLAAQQTLEDLQSFQQVPQLQYVLTHAATSLHSFSMQDSTFAYLR